MVMEIAYKMMVVAVELRYFSCFWLSQSGSARIDFYITEQTLNRDTCELIYFRSLIFTIELDHTLKCTVGKSKHA